MKDLKHPGIEVRNLIIEEGNLSIKKASEALGVNRTSFTRLISGSSGISANMAFKIAKYTHTDPQYWMNLQSDFDADMSRYV